MVDLIYLASKIPAIMAKIIPTAFSNFILFF